MLTLHLATKENGSISNAVLYTVPVRIPAIAWRSTLSDDEVDAGFKRKGNRLQKTFMLGPEASVQLPVSSSIDSAPFKTNAIGYIAWLTQPIEFDYGTPICRVDLIGKEGVILESVFMNVGTTILYHFSLVDRLSSVTERSIGSRNGNLGWEIALDSELEVSSIQFVYLQGSGALLVSDVILFRDAPQ
jgi:hypothetical protein